MNKVEANSISSGALRISNYPDQLLVSVGVRTTSISHEDFAAIIDWYNQERDIEEDILDTGSLGQPI